jgi:ribulose 1,5-bisphosphate synthetase/thiazole synthase
MLSIALFISLPSKRVISVETLWYRSLAMASPTSLDIAIVGAGIAGLGAAIALSRIGHKVEVCSPSLDAW